MHSRRVRRRRSRPSTSECWLDPGHVCDARDVGGRAPSLRVRDRAVEAGGVALVRPPGHHALEGAAMGFCIFGNAAIAARHAQRELGCRRVAVVDFDVHHGNGTEALFRDDPSVLTVSLHQWPFWPGSGGPGSSTRGHRERAARGRLGRRRVPHGVRGGRRAGRPRVRPRTSFSSRWGSTRIATIRWPRWR